MSRLVAATLGGVLVLSACGSDDDEGESNDEGGGGPSGTITYAMAQPFQAYNNTTASANTVANGQVTEWVLSGFWHFGNEDGQLVEDTTFGTYEKTADDPLTVEYTINEEAVWSDGESIDCDDIMLWWTAQSGAFDGLFSAVGTDGVEDTAKPECAPGDKSFALVYDTPFADWIYNGPNHGNQTMLPAHVVAEQGGLTSEEFLTALQGDDPAPLQEAATFYNEGWTMAGGLPDPALIPSSGPYIITDFQPEQSVTLTYNENYWGDPPAAEEIVIRMIAEEEQVAALQNREVDIIEPQPTVDLAEQITSASDIESQVAEEYTYEHLDFNFNDGPFADSLPLRQAFALCVPRETLVENLIRPVVPDAQVKDVRNVAPWDPGYEQAVEASAASIEEFGTQDIERARQILEEEDAVGTTVRLATLDNQRRNDAGTLITEACNEAGFNIEFTAELDFFDSRLPENRWDVAMFAWSGSPDRSGWNSTFRSVTECTPDGKGNNNGCYSNPELDELLDQVLQTSDLAEAERITAEIEALLWEDMVTIPLYQHPGITAWSPGVENVVPNPSQNGIAWNAYEWSRV
ncbi:ABC transporter family substrate-binding protein [Streptomyces litchfieldiae]|uniref:ABC transporter family substrate-binding protein n=1 Tax=Streptomyces litchfieldiae TaxID=3075543 RepID=A0ABU2MTN9_9ACTN|nr:ABC transporter family substrate-binding protein [Streptomyces sp. DSM 44938]MDT0345004.1 ABC transporter family substrate-binding protein [Streptomyces sp. DSM 44938]